MKKYSDFTLYNCEGKKVALSERLKSNIWLFFYRGTF